MTDYPPNTADRGPQSTVPLPELGECIADASDAGGHTEYGFQPCVPTTEVTVGVPPTLPATGVDPYGAMWVGFILLVAGVFAFRLGRAVR